MRSALVVLLACAISLVAGAQTAVAAPADVSVRIEGVSQTIFDRVVHTDGHDIQASSDDSARRCDGTNLDANEVPGPTPTAASVDAMAIVGQTFDGDWYTTYDDYFITRWGSEEQSNDNGWWWGILVNGEFTPVGGCQFPVVDGDQILWINDAFSGRPMLSLEGPETATVGTPVTVEVSSDLSEAYEGATVGGINAAAAAYPANVVEPGESDAEGKAQVTFTEPGWKRLKARDAGTGPVDRAVASNSIDICVERIAGSGCTGQPPSRIPAQVGQAPAVEVPEPGPTCETDPSLCPPEPSCETDASLCPPEPTCETDPSLCPPEPGRARLQATAVKIGPKLVRPGRPVTVAVTVKNTGSAAAQRVKLCLGGDRRLKPGGCKTIKQLQPGGAKSVRLQARVRFGAKPGKAKLKVTFSASGVKAKSRTGQVRIKRPVRR